MSGPTLADVARAAEVSTATVSHALNGTGRLADSTRRRVREVAIALGYGAQRAPRAGKTLGVAVTTYAGSAWNFLDVPYFAQLLTAATATAHAHGYALTILPATCGAETPWHTLTVDGMLLLDSPTDDPVLRALRARGIPLVFDGRPVDPRPGDIWVDNDHIATTREVLGHLTASGARRIALHAGYGDEHYTRTVTRSYQQWCHENARTPLVLTFDPYDTSGHGFDAVFAARACDAVYTVYDPGGRQVLAAAARHGLRIPDDLLLVCASEDQAYAESDPPVSTVTLHPATIAETAVTALVSRLSSTAPPPPLGALTVPAVLHPRRSSRRRARSGCTRPGG
ncbi:LacI family DNA-binding transcriptional regulator [Streptomyces sp. NPDC014622]|uniref:LacI family DNA-binding transcriptional regulator n=1 Tax=Streptomyces sp. NPDC014622 TaxID=3364874 RepID=UPI0036FE616F